MITETEVKEIIKSEIPTLSMDLILLSKPKDLFKAVQCLADHTKELIRGHQSTDVIQCFTTAHKLLTEGTAIVKYAVVNLYIDPVSRLLERSFAPEPIVRSEFIKDFGREYYKLIYSKNP